MICRALSGFKLFSKVSADGSDRQNAHKTSENAAVLHNFCANITLYIPVFLVISSADFYSKYFFKIILSNIILCIPISNSLYPDQARIFVKPDLGPNC